MRLNQIITEAFWTEVPFDKSPTGRDTITLNLDYALRRIKRGLGGNIQPVSTADSPVITDIPGDQSQKIINMLTKANFSVALSTREKIPHENRLQVKLASDVSNDAFLYVPGSGNLYYSPTGMFR